MTQQLKKLKKDKKKGKNIIGLVTYLIDMYPDWIISCSSYKKADRHRREKKSNLLPALGPLKDHEKLQVIFDLL